MRFFLKMFLLLLFWADPCHAHLLIKALMHTDDHIDWDHRSLVSFLSTELFNRVPPVREVTIEPSVPDFMQAWRSALSETLNKNTKEDLYILMSSHGLVGRVSFNKSDVKLNEISEEIGSALRRSEEAGFIRNVYFIFSACHSGSVIAPIKQVMEKYNLKSKISVIASAPVNRVSHSTVLHSYLKSADKYLSKMLNENADYCKSCSPFERLGKMVGGVKLIQEDDGDIPTFWSSDPMVMETNILDLQHEMQVFAPETIRLLKDPKVFLGLFQQDKNSKLYHFIYHEQKTFLFANFMKLLNLNKALSDGSPIESALTVIESMSSPTAAPTHINMVELFCLGYALGWHELNRSLPGGLGFYNKIKAVLDPRRLYVVESAIRRFKIEVLLERRQVSEALLEYSKLADIRVGWQHMASPIHSLVHKATQVFIKEIMENLDKEPQKQRELVDRILSLEHANRAFFKEVTNSTVFGLSLDLNRFPNLIKKALQWDMVDYFPIGVSKIKVLEAYKELEDEGGFRSPEAQERWLKTFKSGYLLFDSEIEAGNRILGLGLTYRHGPQKGQIATGTLSCRDLTMSSSP